MYHITTHEPPCEMALEALLCNLRTFTSPLAFCIVIRGTHSRKWHWRAKNYLLDMEKRRKEASSASVIWYIVLFGQKYTDRPIFPSSPRSSVRTSNSLRAQRVFSLALRLFRIKHYFQCTIYFNV